MGHEADWRRVMTLPQTTIVAGEIVLLASSSGWAQSLVAAVLPSSRSVEVGRPATAFVTIINAGQHLACGFGFLARPSVAAYVAVTGPGERPSPTAIRRGGPPSDAVRGGRGDAGGAALRGARSPRGSARA